MYYIRVREMSMPQHVGNYVSEGLKEGFNVARSTRTRAKSFKTLGRAHRWISKKMTEPVLKGWQNEYKVKFEIIEVKRVETMDIVCWLA